MCFMDRIFCTHSSECANYTCRRNLTPALSERAREWWSHDPDCVPIAYSDFKGTEYCENQGGFMPPQEAYDPARQNNNSDQ